MNEATRVANSGFAPFNMPVSAEETRCSAKGNMLSGKANQSTPSHATAPQSARATGFLAAGNRASVENPMQILKKVTPFGAIARNPSAMKRKEAPHMRPGTMRSAKGAAVRRQPKEQLRHPLGGALGTAPVLRVFLRSNQPVVNSAII